MIYFLQRANGDIKIGTTKRYTQRLHELETGHGNLRLLALIEGSFKSEKDVHRELRNFWTGEGEWFQDAPEIHQFIASQDCLPLPKKKAQSRVPYSLTARVNERQETMRNTIIAALVQGGTINKAAKLLGIHHSTLIYQMEQNKIELEHIAVIKVSGKEISRFQTVSKTNDATSN